MEQRSDGEAELRNRLNKGSLRGLGGGARRCDRAEKALMLRIEDRDIRLEGGPALEDGGRVGADPLSVEGVEKGREALGVVPGRAIRGKLGSPFCHKKLKTITTIFEGEELGRQRTVVTPEFRQCGREILLAIAPAVTAGHLSVYFSDLRLDLANTPQERAKVTHRLWVPPALAELREQLLGFLKLL
jgi:hypothetical protein